MKRIELLNRQRSSGIDVDQEYWDKMMDVAIDLSLNHFDQSRIAVELLNRGFQGPIVQAVASAADSERAALVRKNAVRDLGKTIFWFCVISLLVFGLSYLASEGKSFYYVPAFIVFCILFSLKSLYALVTGRPWDRR